MSLRPSLGSRERGSAGFMVFFSNTRFGKQVPMWGGKIRIHNRERFSPPSVIAFVFPSRPSPQDLTSWSPAFQQMRRLPPPLCPTVPGWMTEQRTEQNEERRPRAALKSCLTGDFAFPRGISHLINLPGEYLSLAVKSDDKAPLQTPFLEMKCHEKVTEGQVLRDASVENVFFFQLINQSTTHD